MEILHTILNFIISPAHAGVFASTALGSLTVYFTAGYIVAGIIAAVVRVLVLRNPRYQPPKTWKECARQGLLSLIIVSCLAPLAAACGIPDGLALIVGLVFAAVGPEKSLAVIVDVFLKTIRTVVSHADFDPKFKEQLKNDDQADLFEDESKQDKTNVKNRDDVT